MPGFNQKGPMGQGSRTGRKMGRCTNFGANLKNQTPLENDTSNTSGLRDITGRGYGGSHGRGGRRLGKGRQNRFRGDF